MTGAPFVLQTLGKEDRTGLVCGNEQLDRYFRQQVSQDVRRRVAACFIASDVATGTIAGYYTLSSYHIYLDGLDDDLRKKLPRYPIVPAVRLGRLAIDEKFQGQKLGAALLVNAVARSIRSEIAMNMMVVDAKDDGAAAFYRHHGFRPDPAVRLQLYAPLEGLARALGID